MHKLFSARGWTRRTHFSWEVRGVILIFFGLLEIVNGPFVISTANLVDCNYRGEIKILVYNYGDRSFLIRRGRYVARLICTRCEMYVLQEEEVSLYQFRLGTVAVSFTPHLSYLWYFRGQDLYCLRVPTLGNPRSCPNPRMPKRMIGSHFWDSPPFPSCSRRLFRDPKGGAELN